MRLTAKYKIEKNDRRIAEQSLNYSDWIKIQKISHAMLGTECRLITTSAAYIREDIDLSPVCALIQQTVKGKNACRECHLQQINPGFMLKKKVKIFTCHAGLSQIMLPVSGLDILLSPGLAHWDTLDNVHSKIENYFAVPGKVLRDILDKTTVISFDEFRATAMLFETILNQSADKFMQSECKEFKQAKSGDVKNRKAPVLAEISGTEITETEIPVPAPVFPETAGYARKKRTCFPGAGARLCAKRVVITGMGMITPLGSGKEAYLAALKQGKSGIRRISFFNPEHLSSQIAGEVTDFNPEQYVKERKSIPRGRASQLAVAASHIAFMDAGLSTGLLDLHRAGVSMGTSTSGFEYAEAEYKKYLESGQCNRVSPYVSIAIFAGATSGEVSINLGLKGPNLTIATGCAASSDAIGCAYQLIRENKADIMLAGGAEAPLTPFMLNAFCSLGVVSRRNADPGHASRPFDGERDGMVVAEGSGVLVLEELQHALARKVSIYGEIIGYASTGDACHMTRPDLDGMGAAHSMQLALKEAGIDIRDIDYINAHGTSTRLNDITETKAIIHVFGKYAQSIPVSAIKSMTGHTLGASGGVEITAALLALQYDFLPPTINQFAPDPDCILDYVPNQARPLRFNTLLKNAFAFGGKNSCLIIRRY